uniref:NS2 n=1 Tax=Ambidensovirus CaaDV2 TaxID=1979849 RepID=A0A1W5YP73_9VIRU|nr:NS2 [Ambidensovirus CaaDV2]
MGKEKEVQYVSESEESSNSEDERAPAPVNWKEGSPKRTRTENELEVTKGISMETVLQKILNNQKPLSLEQPGYLRGFINLLKNEEIQELETCIRILEKISKTWQNNTSKASKIGVVEFMKQSSKAMATSLATSLDSSQARNFTKCLSAFKEIDITREDCFNFQKMATTSTSVTSAATATTAADATGGRKRKRTNWDLDEIDEHIEQRPAELEDTPTFKTFSSITSRVKEDLYTRKSQERWSDYQAKVTLYRTRDLTSCQKPLDKWPFRWKEVEVNFTKESRMYTLVSEIIGTVNEDLDKKGVKWAIRKDYSKGSSNF